MPFRTLSCPKCGAPLPPNAKHAVVTCPFCKATVLWEQPLVRASDYRQALAELRQTAPSDRCATIAGTAYRVLSRIAQGESSEVWLAERAQRITERVLLKATRATEDADLLDNAWRVLQALHASRAIGTGHFSKLIPTPVVRGTAQGLELSGREVFVHRFMSGFVHTLDDVRRAHPHGVEPRHGVWLWRRTLETLDWVHRAGFAHGALLPQHLLVHARDHGVMLVGFSCAGPLGSPLRAQHAPRAALYPKDAHTLSTALDLSMVARSVLYVLGSDDGHTIPSRVPSPIAELLRESLDTPARHLPALEQAARVSQAAHAAFGPPKFVVLEMPGWVQ